MNGSFTTLKPLPGDVDVVSFIPYDKFVQNLKIVEKFHKLGKNEFGVDAHFAATCKWNHRFYQRSLSEEAYWKNVFGFSRPDEDEIRYPKGIIKLNFS